MSVLPLSDVENKFGVTNACKLCTPLGAVIAFKGIEACIPFLHGSQGCATYMRRYLISHFKEPVDVASSNFGENTTIFGGGSNLKLGLKNVINQYNPKVVGVATTCLAETIGDDVKSILREFYADNKNNILPEILHVSTPSYTGSHIDGFYETLCSVAENLAVGGEKEKRVNIIASLISCSDIRHLKEILDDFSLEYTLLPDYSDTFEGVIWDEYVKVPEGGTPLSDIRKMGVSSASIEFCTTKSERSAGNILKSKFDVENIRTALPIGIENTDMFFKALKDISGKETPLKYQKERGRLIDAYVDGHKYTFGKKCAIYGEQDFVVALASFLSEIGIVPVLCASGGETGLFEEKVRFAVKSGLKSDIKVMEGIDFAGIEKEVKELKPDFVIGNSKGYTFTKNMDIPLLRIGFPIHDRFGAQRILHLGYKGTQNLYDMIVNMLIEISQEKNNIGYQYM
jgi:nitrogenase molybdenum-iron protein NifN